MVKKAQLITNVMDRLTQAVVIGVWLLRKVVMSNHPINKGKIELNTRKNQKKYQPTMPSKNHIKMWEKSEVWEKRRTVMNRSSR